MIINKSQYKLFHYFLVVYYYFNIRNVLSSDSTLISKNPHEEWCPNVGTKCKVSPNCKPCERRFLFVISQARSGSTTLKNMINLLPNIRIGGETGRVIPHLQELWEKIKTNGHLQYGYKDIRKAWGHYRYPTNYLSCPAQKLLEALNPPPNNVSEDEDGNTLDVDDSLTIIGSKEVKISSISEMDFLIENFPCSRFIFNIRSDEEALLKSREAAFGSNQSEEKQDNHPKLFLRYEKILGPERAFFMDMISWTKGNGVQFNLLAQWLGYEDCIYDTILHDNAGGNEYLMDYKHTIHLGKRCRYTGRNTFLSTNKNWQLLLGGMGHY